MSKALYPGTFDPITNGHLDVINRALDVFDDVVVTIAVNRSKNALFTPDERIDLIRASLEETGVGNEGVSVHSIDGLLADYAKKVGATSILRGLRTLGDFEYEMQMALMNRRLNPELSTYFMAADERYIHLNSSIVREIARYGADLRDLVPECVSEALRQKAAEI